MVTWHLLSRKRFHLYITLPVCSGTVMCSLQSPLTTALPPLSSCLTMVPSSGSFSILSLTSCRTTQLSFNWYKKKRRSPYYYWLCKSLFWQQKNETEADLKKLQLLLQAPEERMFENTLGWGSLVGFHAQHLLYQISGYNVSWERTRFFMLLGFDDCD